VEALSERQSIKININTEKNKLSKKNDLHPFWARCSRPTGMRVS
jgi:hypothetical protein